MGLKPTTLCTVSVHLICLYEQANRHKALGDGRGNETTNDTNTKPKYMYIHDVIRDVERKKERKKERHLRQWKKANESCLRWDSNPQHSVLRTDALPTELPRQLQLAGSESNIYMRT